MVDIERAIKGDKEAFSRVIKCTNTNVPKHR